MSDMAKAKKAAAVSCIAGVMLSTCLLDVKDYVVALSLGTKRVGLVHQYIVTLFAVSMAGLVLLVCIAIVEMVRHSLLGRGGAFMDAIRVHRAKWMMKVRSLV
jgi:hypothetical protein